MSGPEWSTYMHDDLGVPLEPHEIRRLVVAGALRRLDEGVPLIPGAETAVAAIAGRWPVGLASSADRPVIDTVLDHAGLARFFAATVSSDEAGAGKPAPDVYLAVAERLGVAPETAVAVEDSPNGIRSAKAAGMAVVLIPNPHAPVDYSVLRLADAVLGAITELTPATVEAVGKNSA
jgi:HAD superfamily hydrolase (TIGR01509 family)